MKRPSIRVMLGIYGVLFCAAGLVYFGIVSPLKPGDRTPRGAQHTPFSIGCTYAGICVLLILSCRDVAGCIRRGEAFVRPKALQRRMTLRPRKWQRIGTILIEPGMLLRLVMTVREAQTERVHLAVGFRLPCRPLGCEAAPVVCKECDLWWEAENSQEVDILPPDCESKEYEVHVMATCEAEGVIDLDVTGVLLKSRERRRYQD